MEGIMKILFVCMGVIIIQIGLFIHLILEYRKDWKVLYEKEWQIKSSILMGFFGLLSVLNIFMYVYCLFWA